MIPSDVYYIKVFSGIMIAKDNGTYLHINAHVTSTV